MWKAIWTLVTRPPDLTMAGRPDENVAKVHIQLFMPLFLRQRLMSGPLSSCDLFCCGILPSLRPMQHTCPADQHACGQHSQACTFDKSNCLSWLARAGNTMNRRVHVKLFMPLFLQLVSEQAGVRPAIKLRALLL